MMTESNRVGSLLTPPESYRRALCVAAFALEIMVQVVLGNARIHRGIDGFIKQFGLDRVAPV